MSHVIKRKDRRVWDKFSYETRSLWRKAWRIVFPTSCYFKAAFFEQGSVIIYISYIYRYVMDQATRATLTSSCDAALRSDGYMKKNVWLYSLHMPIGV